MDIRVHQTLRYSEYTETNFRACPKKSPQQTNVGDSEKGDDLLSHITAVPSAQTGLTSLFGMERGEPRRYNHLKGLPPPAPPAGESRLRFPRHPSPLGRSGGA